MELECLFNIDELRKILLQLKTHATWAGIGNKISNIPETYSQPTAMLW